jgi:hypothetical protein
MSVCGRQRGKKRRRTGSNFPSCHLLVPLQVVETMKTVGQYTVMAVNGIVFKKGERRK